jgi:hypothetical protein
MNPVSILPLLHLRVTIHTGWPSERCSGGVVTTILSIFGRPTSIKSRRIAISNAAFGLDARGFLDGNGRIGRLLIAALFEHWGLRREPLSYLSGYLKQHQSEYYRRLSAIRTEGNWESWVSFLLDGVAVAAAEAEQSVIEVTSLVAADRKRLLQSPKAGPASYRLFEMLPMMPRFTIERVRQQLDTTFPTANAAVKVMEDLGIVVERTGLKKNRSYSYQAYVNLLSR